MSNGKLNRKIRSAWFRKDEQEWLRLKSKRHIFIRPDEHGYYKVKILENHFHTSIANKFLAKKWDNTYGGYILKEREPEMVSTWERYDELSEANFDYGRHGHKRDHLYSLLAERMRPLPNRGIMVGTPGHMPAVMATMAMSRHDGKVEIIEYSHNEKDLWELEHRENEFNSKWMYPLEIKDITK